MQLPGNNNPTYFLVTNNHVLDISDTKNNKIIDITLNDDSLSRKISIKNSRKSMTCSKLDITLIEIHQNSDKINDYLELDEEINKDINILEKTYRDKSIYVLHYPKATKSNVSYGLLNQIQESNKIIHSCSTEEGSSGSPILSLDNNKIIGIHRGTCRNNIGIFIKNVLDGLYLKYKINHELKLDNNILSKSGERKKYSNKNNNHMANKNNDLSNSLSKDKNIITKNNDFSNLKISSIKGLLVIMENLTSQDESEKIDSIIILHDILCSNYQQNKFILIPNIDNVIKKIIQMTHELFYYIDELKKEIISLKYAKYLVIILCKLTSNKELIKHISYKVLYDLCY